MRKLVSVSTEPTKNINELIAYSNQLFGIADFMHCDVMDKDFVGRELLSVEDIKVLNQNCGTMLDVHLMTKNLKQKYYDYIDAGANILTVHFESFQNKAELVKTLENIQKKHALAGISFNPDTNLNQVLPFLKYCNLVLVMSVVPGKSGQKFITETYEKVKTIKQYIQKNNLNILLEVDGGITPEISKKLFECGADIVVSGSYVYKSDDKKSAINMLKNL